MYPLAVGRHIRRKAMSDPPLQRVDANNSNSFFCSFVVLVSSLSSFFTICLHLSVFKF